MRDLCLTTPFLLALTITGILSSQVLIAQAALPPYIATLAIVLITLIFATLIATLSITARLLWRFNLEYRSRTGPSFRLSTEDNRSWWQDPESLEPAV